MATKKTTKTETVADAITASVAAEADTKASAGQKVTKSTTARKTTSRKTAAEKDSAAEKKTTTRRTAVKANTEVYIQWWGKEVYAKSIVEDIKKIWKEEMGRKLSEIKDLKVYVKPEENAAHYVINGDITGSISL